MGRMGHGEDGACVTVTAVERKGASPASHLYGGGPPSCVQHGSDLIASMYNRRVMSRICELQMEETSLGGHVRARMARERGSEHACNL